jgi:hypothetical protein
MLRRALGLVVVAASPALAQTAARAAPPPGIADNSFLVEEAYNQEEGVIQHISTFSRPFGGAGWSYTFTEEWPVPGQRHQLSATIPVQAVGGRTGLGDLALSYRFQALDGSRGGVAFSPRVSVLAPTGSSARGLGTGGAGVQLNLPLSAALGPGVVAHSNLGATWIHDANDEVGHEADVSGWHAGQSLIWLVSPTFNVMLEVAFNRTSVVTGPGLTERSDSLYLNPGVRWAHNFSSGLQIVPGIAFPIGVGPSRGDEGLFLYLSFEHPFRRSAR